MAKIRWEIGDRFFFYTGEKVIAFGIVLDKTKALLFDSLGRKGWAVNKTGIPLNALPIDLAVLPAEVRLAMDAVNVLLK